jgi:hypothetical protein
MSSPKKRRANRANALRSTGPQTAHGRTVVSLNALKHGLSSPVDTSAWRPEISAIAKLLAVDDIPETDAKDLATKIIDFERNLAELRSLYLADLGITAAPAQAGKAGRPKNLQSDLDWIQEHLDDPDAYDPSLSGKQRREERKLMGAIVRFLGKVEIRRSKELVLNTQRYYKRSSNQLVKAIRGCLKGENNICKTKPTF